MRKNLSLFKQIKIALGLVITTALLVILTNVQSFAVFTNIDLTKVPQYKGDFKVGNREQGTGNRISQNPSIVKHKIYPLP